MEPIAFPEANHNWTRPEDMTDEQCGSLPAFVDRMHSISCWRLSPDELAKVAETGVVWLGVAAGGLQPPVWLAVDTPFPTQDGGG